MSSLSFLMVLHFLLSLPLPIFLCPLPPYSVPPPPLLKKLPDLCLDNQQKERQTICLVTQLPNRSTNTNINNIISENLMNLSLRLLFKIKTSSDTICITHKCTKLIPYIECI